MVSSHLLQKCYTIFFYNVFTISLNIIEYNLISN